jgi:hypothetical protein
MEGLAVFAISAVITYQIYVIIKSAGGTTSEPVTPLQLRTETLAATPLRSLPELLARFVAYKVYWHEYEPVGEVALRACKVYAIVVERHQLPEDFEIPDDDWEWFADRDPGNEYLYPPFMG